MAETNLAAVEAKTIRSRSNLLMVLLLLAFFALWLWQLGRPALSGDESFVAAFAPQSIGSIFQRLNSDEPHPPLYYALMHGWSALFGTRPEFNVRLSSLFLGLLLLSLMYRVARDLGLGYYRSLLPVVLVGFFPHVVLHLREARMYAAMIVALAVMLLFALRFERLPRRVNVLVMAVATALPLLTHYFNAPFVAVIGVWGLFAVQKDLRWRWLMSQLIPWIMLALWLPLGGSAFFNPTSLSQGKTWSVILPPWETLVQIFKTAVFGYRDTAATAWLLTGGALLVGGSILGSWSYAKPKRWLLLAGMLIPLVAYALLCWAKPVYHPKYVLPWLLFAALAFSGLTVRHSRAGSAAYAVLLLIMVMPMINTVRRPYDPGIAMSTDDHLTTRPRDLGRWLTTYLAPSDVFGQTTPDAMQCYYEQYYFQRDMGCELLPVFPAQSVTQLKTYLDQLFVRHSILWLLQFRNPAWDPNNVAEAALAQGAIELGEEQVAGQSLKLYTNPAVIQRELRSTEAVFSDTVKLEGVWFAPRRAAYVVLKWQALANQPPLDTKVFIHLIDRSGQIMAQQDGVPVRWTRPFRSWQQDEELFDVYELPLPEGIDLSQVSLRVGLYDPETGVRVPAYSRSGERQPGDAIIVPLSDSAPPS